MLLGPSQHDTYPVGLTVFSGVGVVIAVSSELHEEREDEAEVFDCATGVKLALFFSVAFFFRGQQVLIFGLLVLHFWVA